MNILQLQHEIAEATEVIDAFQPTSLIESCFINNGYFLAASVACYNLQHRQNALSPPEVSRTRDLLAKSFQIWNGTLNLSEEAITLVAAIRVVLGYPQQSGWEDAEGAHASTQVQGQTTTRSLARLSLLTNNLLIDASPEDVLTFSDTVTFFDELPLMMADLDPDAGFALPHW